MLRVIFSLLALSMFALVVSGCHAEGDVQPNHATSLTSAH
jgi:hypothetical protein